MNALRCAAATVAGVFYCACETGLPWPARAAQVEQQQCAGVPAGLEDLRFIQSTRVLKAESKCHVDYCNGGAQVFGVKLVVQPAEAMSAADLAKALRCHGARAVLGKVAPAPVPSDPYWLPDSQVDIDVRDEAGHFLVTLSGDSVTDNLRILHRALAFAAARQ